jgi:hypothetical protein
MLLYVFLGNCCAFDSYFFSILKSTSISPSELARYIHSAAYVNVSGLRYVYSVFVCSRGGFKLIVIS